MDRDRTHWDGCWRDPAHHECAVERAGQTLAFVDAHAELQRELREIRAAARAIVEWCKDEEFVPLQAGCQSCTSGVTPGPVKLCPMHTLERVVGRE